MPCSLFLFLQLELSSPRPAGGTDAREAGDNNDGVSEMSGNRTAPGAPAPFTGGLAAGMRVEGTSSVEPSVSVHTLRIGGVG
jgi:hypothetical protein